MIENIEIKDSDLSGLDGFEKKEISEVFNHLVKTVKAKLVYPASSKLPQQFLETFYNELSNALEKFDELGFKVDADRVSYKNEKIYQAISKSENFAHAFFRDGVIEIKFRAGVEFEEIQKFVEILYIVMRSASVDDDLATMLWEASFKHIAYELMDDSLDIETYEYGTSSLKTEIDHSNNDFAEIFKDNSELGLTEDDFDLDSEKNKRKKRPAGFENIPDNVADYISKITIYDEEEENAIKKIIEDDSKFDQTNYVTNALFELLGLETDNAGYNETLEIISKIRDDFIKSGDIQSAIMIFERTLELEEALNNLSDPKAKRISEFIKVFSASERVRVITDMLNNTKEPDYELITKYLKMLSWEAIDPLVWALGELNHYPARKAVCRALELIAVAHVDVIGKHIEDPKWFVVRNIVMILGKLGSSKAVDYFKRTINHQDIRVRKETIISASKLKHAAAADFLVVALRDDNETIQTMALREIVRRDSAGAFSYLEKMITDKSFRNRTPDRAREILEGYAKLGKSAALELLTRIATKITLFPSKSGDRLKIYAVRAISFIQGRDARRFLDKLAKARNKAIADSAKRAIIRRSKGGDGV